MDNSSTSTRRGCVGKRAEGSPPSMLRWCGGDSTDDRGGPSSQSDGTTHGQQPDCKHKANDQGPAAAPRSLILYEMQNLKTGVDVFGGDSTNNCGPGGQGDTDGVSLEVRRGARTGPTLVVETQVTGAQVEAIMDMGAEATLLSEGFYDSIQTDDSSHRQMHLVV